MALLTVIHHLPLSAVRVAAVAPGDFLDCRVEVLVIFLGPVELLAPAPFSGRVSSQAFCRLLLRRLPRVNLSFLSNVAQRRATRQLVVSWLSVSGD